MFSHTNEHMAVRPRMTWLLLSATNMRVVSVRDEFRAAPMPVGEENIAARGGIASLWPH
jgi:hypothetical protein